MASPCNTCAKCENPKECVQKNCEAWQGWFLDEWKKFNRYFETHKKDQVKEDGK